MRIIQISDSHLSLDRPKRLAELESCIRQINDADPQPDIVVHTGDIAHNGLAEEYLIARELMDNLSVPYIVLAGNRDKRSELLKTFVHVCSNPLDERFVQYSMELANTRLICVDTVSNTSNKGQLCQTRLRHIGSLLAAEPLRPTALLLHHPPFAVDVAPDPFQFEEWSEAVAVQELMLQHRQVQAIYCGHVHREARTTVGQIPAHVATCIASDLRWDSVTDCVYMHTIGQSAQIDE